MTKAVFSRTVYSKKNTVKYNGLYYPIITIDFSKYKFGIRINNKLTYIDCKDCYII